MKLKLFSSFWFRSIFYTLLNRFSLIIFGVAGYMILAKVVFPTAVEMGIWSLFLSVVTMVETIKQALLRNPMIKFLSEPAYSNQKNKVQSVALLINIVFSILVIILIIFFGAAFSRWLNFPQLYPLCLWGILIIILLIPFNHYEVLLQADFQFKQIFIGYLFKQGIFLAGIVFFLIFFRSHLTLLTLVKIQIVALALAVIAMFFRARAYFQKGFDLDKELLIRMMHFGKYIFGTNVFSTLSRSADQFITATFNLGDYVAYYNVVGRINNMMDVPSLAVADVLYPKNVEAMANSGTDKVRYYFERMVGTILSIILPLSIGILIFPGIFIKTFASSKYLPAVPILELMMLVSFVRPFFYQFGATMDAIGKPHINFWVNLLAMAINFSCIYAGLTYFGKIGAAYGSVVAGTISFSIIYFMLKRTIGIRAREILEFIWEAYTKAFHFAKNFLSKTFKKELKINN